MRLRKKVFLSLMIPAGCLVFCLSTGIAVSQTASEHDAYLEIKKIINRVQTGMKSSDEQIEQGNYDRAQDGTEAAIDSLSILLDLFMPLTERIKLIWEKEKRVIEWTVEVSKEGDRIGKVNPAKVKKLITAQQENIVRTRKAEDAIELQLKQGRDSQNRNDQGRPKAEQKNVQSRRDLLNRVGGLLKQAETYQAAAVESLAGYEMKTAHQSEIKAEKKLKEALEAFQKHQKQNKQQQAGQPSQSGNENQPQKNRQSHQKDSQKPNQDSGKSEAKSDIKQDSEKKLTPKEALKELYRIRKEADAEKKRREKAVGKQGTPGRAPIEKDW